MDVEQLGNGVGRLNIADTPEAGALATAVATAGVGATSSPASETGFSKAADDNPSFTQEGAQRAHMDALRGNPAGPGAGNSGLAMMNAKDNEIEGKLFIGGISWQTSEEGLRQHFGKYGMLADIALMKDKYTGHPRGFGFITFEDISVLDEILSQEHYIDGKIVDVKRAVPKSEAPGPSSRSKRPAENNKIFVGGLAPTVMMAEFRRYFETFGGVLDAVVMFDRQTQRSRGFGFVTFQEDAVVHEIMMSTHEINGKMVEVKRAEPKENRSGRTPRVDFSGVSSPALGPAGLTAFPEARRSQSFGATQDVGAGYGSGSSFAYNSGPTFSTGSSSTYGQQAAVGFPGYGYNGQLYSSPPTYGYSGRGAGTAYSTDGGNASGSFPVLVPQAGYGLQPQDGQPSYTQTEFAVALRNQQVQVQQQAARPGDGTYGNQPY